MPDDLEMHYFECECRSDEHAIRFLYDPEDGSITVSTFLGHAGAGFFGRLWKAAKYVCGYRCKYGHFDSTILRAEDKERLVALLSRGASGPR